MSNDTLTHSIAPANAPGTRHDVTADTTSPDDQPVSSDTVNDPGNDAGSTAGMVTIVLDPINSERSMEGQLRDTIAELPAFMR